MNQDPAEIRRQIERTRERLGETAEAIRYKIDFPARVRERLGGAATTTLDNPLRLAAGATVAGFVAGLIVPMTGLERQTLPKMRRSVLRAAGWLNPLEAVRRFWQGA